MVRLGSCVYNMYLRGGASVELVNIFMEQTHKHFSKRSMGLDDLLDNHDNKL